MTLPVENVRFCLDTFLDTALKIQNAPPVPVALPYSWVFDDVISPVGNFADLFQFDGKKRRAVRRLKRGEEICCKVFCADGAIPTQDIETARILGVRIEELDVQEGVETVSMEVLYVERKSVKIRPQPQS